MYGARETAALEAQGVAMGGGGAYGLLYFLTRRLAPAAVLETGVASGWSTHAFLTALRANGGGSLYSSDFPYFRLPTPEKWIAHLVPEDLRGPNWSLHIKGDRANLPEIFSECDRFDLVHYDSDKRRAGRWFFFESVRPHLAPGAVLVMDDVNDDLFFRDEVAAHDPSCRVFAFQGKFIGISGL